MESHREAPTSGKTAKWLYNAHGERVLVFAEPGPRVLRRRVCVSAARTGPWKWEKDRAEQRRARWDARVQGTQRCAPESPCHLHSVSALSASRVSTDTWESPENAATSRTSSCVNVGAYSCTFFAIRPINDVCFVTRGPSRDNTGIDAL